MPNLLPVDCQITLLNMAATLGAITALAQQPYSTWDQGRITDLGNYFIESSRTCAPHVDLCDVEILNLGQRLVDLRGLGEEADPGKVDQQVNDIAESTNQFISCVFDFFQGQIKDPEELTNGYQGSEYPDFPWKDWNQFPFRKKQVR
ncbi:MAG: hypothetical protein COB10_11475 [Planctomycetota bacterium]|nr:MAG: hypothetical protein COB10_11475 [Planctomycetota bacterium]